MNQLDARARPWPPAFSDAFLDDAHALLRKTGHVMIVGPLGSNRGTLATALSGPSAPTVWGREAQAFGPATSRYAAINQLLPGLHALPHQALDEVTSQAEATVCTTFGRPTMSLREADLCDSGSIAVLTHLVDARLIRLVSTVGPDTADEHPFARTAERIDLAPLDADTITHLLAERFNATPHHTTVSMLSERSQGAYAVLKELADSGFSAGQIRAISGHLITDVTVPAETVDDLTDAKSPRWGPRFAQNHPARDLIDVTALAMSLDRREAHDVFGDDAISAALSLGAVRARGMRLDFASRVEALILQRRLGSERRAELHAAYSGRLQRSTLLSGTAPRIAQWWMSVDEPLPHDLAVRAAARANREGRHHLALQFVDSIERADRPSRLLVEQCHALSENGDQITLVPLLESIDTAALDDADLIPYLRIASRYLSDEVVFDTVAAEHTTTPADNTARKAVLSLATLCAEAYQGGSESCRHALMTLAMSGDLSPVNQAVARSVVAMSLRYSSQVHQAADMASAAADVLIAASDAATCDVEAVVEAEILCHISAADLDSAHTALTRYSQPGIEFGNLGRLGTALWGLHAFFSGDLSAAQAHAQLCLARSPASDPHLVRARMEAIAAQILAQRGDTAHVEDLLVASRERDPHPLRPQDLECRISQACAHDAIGDPDEALQLLRGVIEEAHEHGLTLLEVDAAVLCVQIGGPVHLDDLLRAVEFVDPSYGTSWIWGRFAWAIRDNAMRDLVALAEELHAGGLSLFAAEVAQFTLDIARRAADMTSEQRQQLKALADRMQHRHITRPS